MPSDNRVRVRVRVRVRCFWIIELEVQITKNIIVLLRIIDVVLGIRLRLGYGKRLVESP